MKQVTIKPLLRSCFCVIVFLSGSSDCLSQYYAAEIYKDKAGMVSNRISDMVQMPNGELWFATQGGLVTYDGLEWKTVPDSTDVMPISGRVQMTVLPDSSLYIIGANNSAAFTFLKYKNGRWSNIPLPDQHLSLNSVDSFELDNIMLSSNEQGLVLSYNEKVFFYQNANWVQLQINTEQESLHIHKIGFVNDSLILATNQGLAVYHDNKINYIISGPAIYNFYYDTKIIYLLGEDWIGGYKDGKLEKYRDNERIGLTGQKPITNLLLKNGKLYYSLKSPLYCYDLSNNSRQIIISGSLNDDYTCMKAMFDHEQNLWIATLRGAFKISNLNVYSYNKAQLMEDEVTAVLETSNGDIFLGNNSGFNILTKEGDIQDYSFPSTFLQSRVMDIIEFEGNVYLAAHTAGIVQFNKGKLTHQFPEGDNTRALDLHIYEGKLFASSGNKLFQKQGNEWKLELELPKRLANSPVIRKIFFDHGAQYLLTPVGIFDYKKGTYIFSDNLNESDIYTAIRYQGHLLFGSSAGLTEIRNGKIILPLIVKDPFKKAVYSLLLDTANNLWAGSEVGIFNINKNKLITHLYKRNGLIGNEVNRNAFRQLKDGRMLIGTDEGLSIYSPSYEWKYPIPKLELTNITVNNDPVTSKTLRHDQNNIRFHFRGISFYDEKLMNYRVRFEGFDENWQHLPYHNQRSMLYTNLQPGSYRFLVQARVADGEWSYPIQSGIIKILPAYYDTLWFKGLIVLAIASLVFALVWYRNKHLKIKNVNLEEIVYEKTKALNQQNAELVKTISELKNTQGQLIQSEKLASMGHLTAGIAHEMNNPLNYIRGGAECLKQNLKEINELASRMEKGEEENKTKFKKEYEYLIHESNQLIVSILNGAEKSTHIVKSLSSFTSDAQNFYSFVELEKEVETALTLLNNHIGFRITINRFFGNVPRLECYPAKINQMLVNILLNATQAIKGEGEITIRIFRKDIKNLALEVSDNGAGVDLEDPEKVFEPFFTTKDNNPGLGLTIVKSIVQDHHGEIRFQSRPSKGTKITVVLPLQQTFHPELEIDPEQ